MNELIEQIIVRKSPKSEVPIKAGIVLLCVIFFLLFFITASSFMLIVMALVVVGAVFVFRSFNLEYEYSWFNNELQIDKIISKSSRRKGPTFDFSRMEVMAPLGSSELLRMENGNYRKMNYTSNDPEALVYSAFVFCNGELVNLLFEPNSEMVNSIRTLNSRKVFD